tara:strand:+ start:2111 stop:3889 length:1779 start_codon:yes stop_codon:yes gene_type:complete
MPSQRFWESSDKIAIGQESIVIESENNLDHTAGQKIQFQIPSNLEFINPKETYLRFDCLLEQLSGPNSKLQLDADIGAQSLIADIRLRTRDGQLLEEIQGYNVLVSLMYDYDCNNNFRNKRALTEGTTVNSPLCQGTNGNIITHKCDVLTNPYFKRETSASTSSSATLQKTAKCLLPLHTGIFQNDRVFPVLMTGDLVLEILLEENKKVVRLLDSTIQTRNLSSNPRILNLDGADASASLTNGTAVTSFYLDPNENSVYSVENMPFAVGDKFFFLQDDTVTVSTTGVIARTGNIYNASNGNSYFTITGLSNESGAGTIPKVKVSVTAGAIDGDMTGLKKFRMVSAVSDTAYPSEVINAKYTLSNIELICQKLTMPAGYKSSLANQMKSGGVMKYDYLSYTNYRFSTLSSENMINLRLPLQNSRAKGILCIPVDASIYSMTQNSAGLGTYYQTQDSVLGGKSALFSDRSGLEGIADFIEKYQFTYSNKLHPNRKVDVSLTGEKSSISQEGLIELEKALAMSEIDVRSFRKFNRNFCVGRAFSLGESGVFDTRGQDFSLQIEYGASQQKNKLWNCFCSHIRSLQISGADIQVIL